MANHPVDSSLQDGSSRFRPQHSWRPTQLQRLLLLSWALLIWTFIPLRSLQAQAPLPSEPTMQQVYLPVVTSNETPTPIPSATPTISPTPTSRSAGVCTLTDEEEQIAYLLRSDPGQQRSSLSCNGILAQVARERAQDMADRDYFGHTNPDGHGPNYLVEQAGYLLPSFYNHTPTGNNIESLAGGYSTADQAWQGWLASAKHRTHVLGENTFFADQMEYGVGHVFDSASTYKHYWVLITAEPGP